MLRNGRHTFILAGLTLKIEATCFVYNEITDTIVQVTSWMGKFDGFLKQFIVESVTEIPARLLAA